MNRGKGTAVAASFQAHWVMRAASTAFWNNAFIACDIPSVGLTSK
jgi:hypothetical protein